MSLRKLLEAFLRPSWLIFPRFFYGVGQLVLEPRTAALFDGFNVRHEHEGSLCANREHLERYICSSESAACLPVFLPCKAQAGESFVLCYASSER